MKQKWCRTTEIHTFNGQPLSEENVPVQCRCNDCGQVLIPEVHSDGRYYVARHKIKNVDAYFAKLKFERQLLKVKAQHEKVRLSKINEDMLRLYNGQTKKGVV